MNPVRKTFQFGEHSVTLETGQVARQADGAVVVTMGKIVVLCTVVAARQTKQGQDFFPLSVHYQEKMYAAGRIPGGFFKREGRPSEKETLTSRLIDRPIRPLFPKGFKNEVQVTCTVLSTDKVVDTDIAAMIGTSAALAISGVPFAAPIGAARVGLSEEEGYILNLTFKELDDSLLNMVVAGTKDAVLMVESEANELTEDEMLGAVLFAQQQYQCVISAIEELVASLNVQPWEWLATEQNEQLKTAICDRYLAGITSAYSLTDKQQRYQSLSELRAKAIEDLSAQEYAEEEIIDVFASQEKALVRKNLVTGQPRIDGRDLDTVRALHMHAGYLPTTHGSALFTRGETQALVSCTLGAMRDAQICDNLEGEHRESFILHYNFPPYSVGECGRLGTPGRREIGHGRLAKRSIQAMMPNTDDFPYSVRVVSEITESNGSSSMASVCGTSMALMDAGVPLKAAVAGIAMGLVKEQDDFVVLTDILGDEDHLGDMDFKVAGTDQGITALQMDIKITGIDEKIMETALEKARLARMNILGQMQQVIAEPRAELNPNAPTMLPVKIDSDKIRDVIGKGGATIRSICEETGADIDIDDSGLIKIYAQDKSSAQKAYDRIMAITVDVEAGQIYKGKVARILDFGAFVNILPGKDGLVHISQISSERIKAVTDVLQEGQEVEVLVLDVDQRGRIKLSMKDVEAAKAQN